MAVAQLNTPEITLRPHELYKFWSHVDKGEEDDCWLWTGIILQSGYGQFYAQGNKFRVHRVSFLIAHNRWPNELVCHTCDVKACVNPKHLFEGSVEDNIRDRQQKERQSRGVSVNTSKLTEEDVVKIRELYCQEPNKLWDIADMYDITASNVSQIARGKTWKHVGGPRWR